MRHLINFLDQVSEVNSTLAKEALIEEFLEKDDVFEKIFFWAYDPFMRYHTTGVDIPTDLQDKNQSNDLFMEEMGTLIWKLHDREVTGNDAKNLILEYFNRNGRSFAEVLNMIVKKDLRCGVGITLLNKVFKKTKGYSIRTFECMLAHKYDVKRIKQWPVRSELKLDGVRCIVRIDEDNNVEFMSRNGLRFTSVDHLAGDVLNYISAINTRPLYLDGELVSGDSHFNVTVSEIKKKNHKAEHAELIVFEILSEDEFTGTASLITLKDRMHRLPQGPTASKVKTTLYKLLNNDAEVQQEFKDALDNGHEGIIVKPLEGTYEPKRSYSWMKLKAEETLDLKITGVFEGEGKYEGKLGGFIVDNEGVDVRVGSGLTDAQREEWWINPPIGVIAEIEFHEETPDGSLRHPRFKQLREDKQ